MAVISIDVRTPRNRELFFAVTGERLRSELLLDRLSGRHNGRLQLVGGMIPGMRLEVDTKAGVAKIIDRMHLKENKELDERIRAMPPDENAPIINNFTHYSKEPVREFILGDNPPHNLATWLYWMNRYVDRDRARLVQGTLPTLEEIRKMGTIWIGDNGGYVQNDKATGRNNVSYLYPPESETAAKVTA